MSGVKVALVHEWLITHGGSEEITGQLCALFPDADLFTLVADPVPSLQRLIGDRRIVTSPLQRIPGATRAHRRLLPLMPWAIEQFDFTGYDLVISVSHAVTKGVRTPPGVPHLNICCSPIRYAWDLQEQYLAESGLAHGVKGVMARALLGRLRAWDRRTADRPTRILAISAFIQERIQRVWGRESGILFPPVETEYFAQGRAPAADATGESTQQEEVSIGTGTGTGTGTGSGTGAGADATHTTRRSLYVTASRFVPYKRIPLIIEAFQQLPDRDLVVIGDGPEWEKAQAAASPNVRLLGHLPRPELREWLQRADGFVFAAEEDFGIAPVEALAAGTPVVAYGKGGALETVGPGCGVFFEAQTAGAIAAAVHRLEAAVADGSVSAARCVAWADRFSVATFRVGLMAAVSALTGGGGEVRTGGGGDGG